ncbi:hypothetical protein C8R48DRAFT_324142 [Suillus tomentosus]|nr:hypothetical protein C8R48DRAFT_324142 [Suillus tomentosus]
MNVSEIYNLTRPTEYPIAFNPFQRPGQRNLGSVRLPNVPNGFTMRVVGYDEQETIHPVSAGVPVPVPDMSECRPSPTDNTKGWDVILSRIISVCQSDRN